MHRAKWLADNPEARKAANKKWSDGNKERFDEIRAAWIEKNWEKRRVTIREWRENNPDKVRIAARAWRAVNPEKTRAYRGNRRARKLSAAGSHTAQEIQQIINLQRGKCGYCRVKLTQKNTHIDHIMPLALGGSNYASNLQALCAKCNHSKCAKHPVEYAQHTGRLI